MKKILLENTGHYTIVDDDDYDKVVAMGKFYESDTGYAVKRGMVHGSHSTIRLHRVIADPPKGLRVDHINGNKLDNRKENLRVVSSAINAWNTDRNRIRKYDLGLPVGIAWDDTRKKYIATRILRRRFSSLEEAKAFQDESELYEHEHRRLRPELPTGINMLRGSKSYNAKFTYKTRKYYLGTFKTVDEAVEALSNKKKEIIG